MKKFLLIFALTLLVFPFIASAQGEATTAICNVFQIAKEILAAIGYGIAVILLIVAGIKYMTAGGDAEKAGSAKGAIVNAVIGIVIVTAAIFILGLAQGLVSDVTVGFNPLEDPCDQTGGE